MEPQTDCQRPIHMPNIREFMAHDHLHCDGVLAHADGLVAAHDWNRAAAAFAQFQTLVLQHFDAEESLLFPAFEAASGMRMGPTQVMRGEHAQMRQLMAACATALQTKDAEDYAGYADTLSIMLQQHNVKEENVLYPMCDQHLADQVDALVPQLQHLLPGATAA
jgi:iron-sulfur cluster repair protein YtfE (RIC family)